jgi:hypothetical protein
MRRRGLGKSLGEIHAPMLMRTDSPTQESVGFEEKLFSVTESSFNVAPQ